METKIELQKLTSAENQGEKTIQDHKPLSPEMFFERDIQIKNNRIQFNTFKFAGREDIFNFMEQQ